MNFLWIIFCLILCSSCAAIFGASKERKLQTNIHMKITEKSQDFAKCAKKSDLFGKFEQKRVRVVLHLDLASSGQIQKFKLDDKEYPEEFINCVFNKVELIQFPKFDFYEAISVEQPFIFSNKA